MRPEKIRGNLFVANLPLGTTDEQVAELFDPYGMVLRAYLARDLVTGETKGHGLVQLAPDKVVDAAIAGLNGTKLEGRRIDVRRADPEMALSPPAPKRELRMDRPRPAPRQAVVVEHVSPRTRPFAAFPARGSRFSETGRASQT